MVRYYNMPAASPVKVGVVAQSPTGEGCRVRIANLDVSPKQSGTSDPVNKNRDLHVKPEQNHIAVLDHVIPALDLQQTPFPGSRRVNPVL